MCTPIATKGDARYGQRSLTWLIWRDVIPIHISAPDMQTVIADIRGFQNRVLPDLARHSQVPLIALRWTEININSGKARSVANALHLVLQIWTNRVHGAASRTPS